MVSYAQLLEPRTSYAKVQNEFLPLTRSALIFDHRLLIGLGCQSVVLVAICATNYNYSPNATQAASTPKNHTSPRRRNQLGYTHEVRKKSNVILGISSFIALRTVAIYRVSEVNITTAAQKKTVWLAFHDALFALDVY